MIVHSLHVRGTPGNYQVCDIYILCVITTECLTQMYLTSGLFHCSSPTFVDKLLL